MNSIYQTSDDFAAYCSQQSLQRLVSIVHLASSTLFFAAKTIGRGFAKTLYDLSDRIKIVDLKRIEWVRVSMDWLAKQAQNASKRLFSTLRDEFEAMGLWTIERQSPRQGKGQGTTKLFTIDFANLFNLARAAILRIHDIEGSEGMDPDWSRLFPDHEFAFFAGWFERLHGYPLLVSDDRQYEILQEREVLISAIGVVPHGAIVVERVRSIVIPPSRNARSIDEKLALLPF
jgi:hypothetical protein